MLFKTLLTRHWLLTFTIMCLSALVVGLSSFNLFYLIKENIDLISRSGTVLLFDGVLEELAQLLFDGIISGVFYILFKACEKVLVEKLLK